MSDHHTIEEARNYDNYGHPHTEARDCEFLEQVFQSYHGSVRQVLDLACGTGRHALILAKEGYSVTGVDISEGMLAVAAEKTAAQDLDIEWVQADARKVEFPVQFDAAYIIFNTMMCWTINDELIGFWEGVHKSLRPGGLFVIEVGSYWASLAHGELKNTTSRWESGVDSNGLKRVRDTTSTVSCVNNLVCFDHHERSWRDGHELAPKDFGRTMRIFSINELDLLARLTHFEILDVFGAMNMTRKIEDPHAVTQTKNSPHSYVLVMRKLS